MAWPSSSSTSRSPAVPWMLEGVTADMEAFDYLVVGAGSAGCAIAARLAEDPAVTVALIEAGPSDHHISVWMPIGMASTVPKAGARNYGYYTAPQDAFNGRQGYQPRGRGLGGSSSINGMVYIRGHRNDYDDWARLGCTGWGYEDVLPYFRRSEHHENYSGRDDNRWHGGSGPLRVSNLRSPNPFSNRFVQAAIQAGYPANGDFNGAEQDGAGLYHVTQHRGERWNTARAYLHQGNAGDKTLSGGRRNLTVLVETQVLRVDFDGARATGLTWCAAAWSRSWRHGAKSSSARARSTRRSSCSRRASAPRRRCATWASVWWPTCRAWARTCRIIRTSSSTSRCVRLTCSAIRCRASPGFRWSCCATGASVPACRAATSPKRGRHPDPAGPGGSGYPVALRAGAA